MSKLYKYVKYILPLIFVLIASYLLISHLSKLISHSSKLIIHSNEWEDFYIEFKIPKEAEIVYSKEYIQFPMGFKGIIRFKLPESKKVEEWLQIIAEKSGILKYKKNEFLYLYEENDMIYRLQYFPDKKIYEAEFSWEYK